MSRLLYRLGRAAALRPWRFVVAWVLVIGAVAGVAGVAGGSLQDDYTLAGTGSQRAADLLTERFPALSGADARVVVHAGKGRVDPAGLEGARRELAKLPHVSVVEPAVPSRDGATALITVRYDVLVTDLAPDETLERLRGATAGLERAGNQVEFGGEVPENVTAPDGVAEVVGVVAALVILLLAFGSVVAAGLPLAVALAGLGAGVLGITILAAFANVATTAPTLAVMTGLGVGIDYALFILTRHREGLAQGLSVHEAAGRANATAGLSVLFAGFTVLLALSGLVLSRIPVFMTMGFATGIVVAATVAGAVTLLPAVLGLAGRRVLRRRDRAEGATIRAESPRVRRWAEHVGRHPWPWLLAALALMLTLAAPALGMRTWPSDASSEPESNTARQAYDLVADAYGPGANGPLLVAVDLRESPDIAGLRARLAATEGVVGVAPPQVSPDGSAAVVVVTPAYGPQDERVVDLVDRVRADVLPPGSEITGLTAAYVDLSRVLDERLWPVIGVVVATSFVMLMIVFRSLLAPLKAAAMNLLSIGAAYGALTAIFQWGWGAELLGLPHGVPVSSFILLLMFAVLFGVSMDYEVFLLSRVREEWLRTGNARASVSTGLAVTGRVISSAALIMVAVFLGFALDPGLVVKQMGVGLAVAVALDATVVRLVLVPATMALLGRANWWLPRPLDRLLPTLEPHGAGVEPAAAPEREREPSPA
ncbi:membrane protein [Actinomadura sp. NBRC 104412]|uniref:MMPL family transporter n=1 Tax=Actinomadura sp. NBRC 104412 TaxID=3032203 RepID=UPI0024A4EC40|nr:MMPL family transporter [Actinomadura sp. NBRC 104412]GLZ04285.1 membrane protein [Actinomadura sp. NBRC 104412]